LPELSVLIETELRVHAQNSSTLNLRQRVDLNLRRVLLLEELVELLEDVGGRFPRFGLEAKLLGGLESEFGGETLLEGDGDGDDGGGVVAGNVLNAVGNEGSGIVLSWVTGVVHVLHTTLAGSNESGSTETTVVENGDVVLVRRRPALSEHDLRRDYMVSKC
jgi:hypothetical protein